MITTAVVLGALAVGYVLGRIRPFDQLDTWLWRRLTFGGPWVHSRRHQVLVFAVHVLVRPAASVRAWRHRHDPPEPLSPPLRVRNLTNLKEN